MLLSLTQQCITCNRDRFTAMENTASKYQIVENYSFVAFTLDHAGSDPTKGREIGSYKDKQGQSFKCFKFTSPEGKITYASFSKKLIENTATTSVDIITQTLKEVGFDNLQVVEMEHKETKKRYFNICRKGQDGHAVKVDLGF